MVCSHGEECEDDEESAEGYRCISDFLDIFLVGGGGKAGRQSEILRIYGVSEISPAPLVRSVNVTSTIGFPAAAAEKTSSTQTSVLNSDSLSLVLCQNGGLSCSEFSRSRRRWTAVTRPRKDLHDFEYSAQAEAPEVNDGHDDGSPVWVTGGGFERAADKSAFLWPSGRVSVGPELPKPLRGHSILLAEQTAKYNYYVVAGGADAEGRISGQTYLGRLRRDANDTATLLLDWRRMSDLATPRYNHFMFLRGETVYVCGGMSWTASNETGLAMPVRGCEELDLVAKNGRWRRTAPAYGDAGDADVASGCVVSHDKGVFVLGGLKWTDRGWRATDRVLRFDETSRGFTTLRGSLTTPKFGCHAVDARSLRLRFPSRRWNQTRRKRG